MKKAVFLFSCLICISVFAQQPPEEGAQKRTRTPEEIEARKQRKAEREKKAAEQTAGQEDAAVSAQAENFADIMGSFSEMAMKFSREDDSDLDVFFYTCKHVSAEAFSRSLEPFLSVNGEIADCEDSDLVIVSDDKKQIEKLKTHKQYN